ncbi:MAG TPA: hypothetical protein VJR29_01525 [bacterium]|nr:hypothetical protein [bacterium]
MAGNLKIAVSAQKFFLSGFPVQKAEPSLVLIRPFFPRRQTKALFPGFAADNFLLIAYSSAIFFADLGPAWPLEFRDALDAALDESKILPSKSSK